MNDLLTKSVEELAPLIKSQKVSPVELTNAVLNRAGESQEKVNDYLTIYREEALRQAEIAEAEIKEGKYRGKYHGIPLGLKDNIFMKDKVTTMGSKIHKDFISSYDATVASKLKKAGAIIIGKQNMHEYAMSITSNNPHFGPVRNPWDLAKTPGGSSGGSGASVAVGSSFASIGTDTAGSIRIPAAACGVVGLKPTVGRVSTYGVYPLSWTQDHVGPITKTVHDAASLLEIITDYDENNPESVNHPSESFSEQLTGDVKDLVIGINEDYFFNDIDAEINKTVRHAIQELVKQGARVEKVEIPVLEDVFVTNVHLTVSEASAIHFNSVLDGLDNFGEDVRPFLTSGAFPSSTDYQQALKMREQVMKGFEEVFKHVDVLISPTLPVAPNNIGDSYANLNGEDVDLVSSFIRLTGPANVAGIPALSIPCGFHDGLPVGLQVMGPAFKEGMVLNVGYAVEQLNLTKGRSPILD